MAMPIERVLQSRCGDTGLSASSQVNVIETYL